jgi:hypothetical protein
VTDEELNAMKKPEPDPRLLCPLRFARLEPGCQQARCAWWIESRHGCALAVIAQQATAPLIY